MLFSDSFANSSDCIEDSFQFYVFDTMLTFEESQQLCRSHGGEIASILSEQENAIVFEIVQNIFFENGIWIGLVDFDDNFDSPTNETSRFMWTDGSDFFFGTTPGVFPWHENEPNNDFGVENCVQILTSDGDWNDQNCEDNTIGVVCKVSCSSDSGIENSSKPMAGEYVGIALGCLVIFVFGMFLLAKKIKSSRTHKISFKLEVLDNNLSPNEAKYRNLRRPSGLNMSVAIPPKGPFRTSTATVSTIQAPLQSQNFSNPPIVKSSDKVLQETDLKSEI